MKKLLEHLSYWRESYLFFPLSLLITVLLAYGINLWTGKPLADGPDFILGCAYNLIKGMFVVVATGFTQNALFGYRSKKSEKLSDDIYDSVNTFGILLLWGYAIWN